MDWLTKLDPQKVADAMVGKEEPPRRIEACKLNTTKEVALEAIQFMEQKTAHKKIRKPTFEVEETEDGVVIYGVPHPEHAKIDMFSKDIMTSVIRTYAVYFKEYLRKKEYDDQQGAIDDTAGA